MTRDGKSIYRNYVLAHVDSNVVDDLIAHDVAATSEENTMSKDDEILASLQNQMNK